MMWRSIKLGCTVAVTAIFLFCQTVYAQEPKKVAIAPFALYAAQDLGYLQKGIVQMLSTRLASDGKVVVLQTESNPAGSPTPDEQARSLGADYLVTGSLTMLGNSVSTDAKVMDLKLGRQVLAFSKAGKDPADIIDHVDQLAAQINIQLFGRKSANLSVSSSAPSHSAAEQPRSVYQHPEKLIPHLKGEGANIEAGEAVNFVAAADLIMRGPRMAFQVQGLTVGDIDGDGLDDIVCIGTGKVTVYHVIQNRISKIIELEGTGSFVGVDALDVNGNGKAEIFVTNFDNTGHQLMSFVLEWDGKALARIAGNLDWYFRVLQVPQRGKVLAGQRQSISDRFGQGIFEMTFKSGTYEPMERLPLPRDLNIYGFAYGSVREPHNIEVVAYNAGGFVQVLNGGGDEEWVTTERYGGSNVFVIFPNREDMYEKDYVYLSPRIQLFDLDEDGIQELFVVKNENISGAFDSVKLYKDGRVEGLKWNELGMRIQWRSPPLSKYIADFALADVNADGKPEMVMAVVQRDRGPLTNGRSYLAVFDLVQPPKKVN